MKNHIHKGPFTCPECGSSNTGQSVKVDYCNDCGWSYGYPFKPIKMKTIIAILLLTIAIPALSQDSTKFTLKHDTSKVEIPGKLFVEFNQINEAIPKLNTRKEEILKDVCLFNESALVGYKFLGILNNKMIFVKTDTIRTPKKKK